MYKHILLPTDGSTLSERAILSGVRLARGVGARVTGLHVTPKLFTQALDSWAHGGEKARLRLRKMFDDEGKRCLAVIADAAREAGVRCECVQVLADAPHEAILGTASRKRCDLIFMASHGKKGSSALVLGSETVKVLTHSPIPVLVHREDASLAAGKRRR